MTRKERQKKIAEYCESKEGLLAEMKKSMMYRYYEVDSVRDLSSTMSDLVEDIRTMQKLLVMILEEEDN